MSFYRIKRDHEDVQRLLRLLEERDPFTGQETLMNLNTGEVADEILYEAHSLGELLIQDMHDNRCLTTNFKGKEWQKRS